MLKIIKIKNNLSYLLLGIILLAHALILTKLIYFPYPELFIYPYLTNRGLKPYSQILDQHFPGLMFLPVNLDNLGMNTPEVARLWSMAIVLITQLMLFVLSSKLLKSRTKAVVVNILYLIWQPFFEGWVLWIDSLLPLLLLPAFYTLYKRRIFITGLLIGLAIVFKQTAIPLSILISIYIFWVTRNTKTTLIFLLGMFIPVGLMVLYFIYLGVLKDFWYWTVVFNLTTYAQFGTKAPPSTGFITRVLFVFGASVLVLFNHNKKLIVLLAVFITGSILGAFERADFVHFQPALPFAVVATAYALERFSKLRSQTWSGRLTIIGMLGYFLISFWWLVIFYKGHLGDRVISFDSDTKSLAIKIRNYTSPQEKIFVFGAEPHLYQMSDTLPAGDIFVFQFPWFFKIAEQRILEGIVKDKPNIVISNRTVKVEDQKIIEFGKDIDKYISQNYEKIDSVGTTEILHRITP